LISFFRGVAFPKLINTSKNSSRQLISPAMGPIKMQKIDFATSTALVTGGSSGIGFAIAQELVARGVRRLIIIAQNEERLHEAANKIKVAGPEDLALRTIKINLAERNAVATVYKTIHQEWNWTVDLLINNAGFGRKFLFAKNPETDTSLLTVDVMVRAVVDMMLQFLPDMIKRQKGGILNVGSTGGFQPVPYTAAYAAAKAFVHTFSQAIRQENIDKGVRVACVIPGVTQTNLDGQGHGERRGLIEMVGVDQPADVAKVAVDALEDNAAARVVGWNNKAFHAVFNLLPGSTIASLVAISRGPPAEE
jgi:short-subunit dehydrogenase